jgi:hypothetical protein
LFEHLQAVADTAAGFGAKFGHADLAHALGLSHDLAKADPRYRDMDDADTEATWLPKVFRAVVR